MDAIASPKSISRNIGRLKDRLKRLREQEEQLTIERRQLLVGAQDPKTLHMLEQLETRLLTTIHQKETVGSRLKELQSMLPDLEKEEEKAKAQLKALTAKAVESLGKLEEADQKILEQFQAFLKLLETRNGQAQATCESTVEGQYLALRFHLSGATGDRIPAHPIGSVLTDQFRRLTLFEPVKPAHLKDQLRELRHQQNRAAKAERLAEEEKRRQALQPV